MEMETENQLNTFQTNPPKKTRYKLIILLILFLFIGIGAYYLMIQSNQTTKQLNSTPAPVLLKSFVSDKYSFGLNYPADWTIVENETNNESGNLYILRFTSSDKKSIFFVTVLDNRRAKQFHGNTNTQKQYNDWLALAIENNQASPSASKKTGNIKIDGIDAVQFLTQTHPQEKQTIYGMLTWVRKDNINYYLAIQSDNSQITQPTSKIYSQILASFKFTK